MKFEEKYAELQQKRDLKFTSDNVVIKTEFSKINEVEDFEIPEAALNTKNVVGDVGAETPTSESKSGEDASK